MKSLQPIVIAFSIATAIVSLHHFGEFLSWFALASFGFCGSQIFLKAAESPEESSPEETKSSETVFPEQVFDLLKTGEVKEAGTDLWTEKPQSDAVEESEPLQLQLEEVADETPDTGLPLKSKSSDFQLIMQQLETLPQKKGRRKAWAVLCDRLAIKGAGKVRDANLINKAQFLADRKVQVPELVKAKVVALRAA